MTIEPSPIKNPFKFLAPYRGSDIDLFYGRTDEEHKLYELLSASNIVLVYGPSGTGKTSLIQCGLSRKYSMPDWIPLFVTRNGNFNQSILAALQQIKLDQQSTDIVAYVKDIYRKYYRPIYLFLDQFEEVFTLADKKNGLNADGEIGELAQLLKTIKSLSEIGIVKIIFIIREEFLGELYKYEWYLPTLFDFRARIESMKPSDVEEVITKSFKRFNISSGESIEEQIQTNLIEGNATSQLAYLQVYLSRLWDYAYSNDATQEHSEEALPAVTITDDTLKFVGKIENILEKYVNETIQNTASELKVETKTIEGILDSFVTEDGTKRPRKKDKIKDKTEDKDILKALEKARLVSQNKVYFELAHDTLAAILEKKRTSEQRLINNLIHSFRTNYQLFERNNKKGYLNEQNVELYDKFKNEIDAQLKEEQYIIDYIEDSLRENENDKLEKEKTSKARKNIAIVAGVLFLVAFLAAIYAFDLLKKNNKQKAKELIQDAKTYEASNDIEFALEKAMKADSLSPNNPEITDLIGKYNSYMKK
ncbi:ATP-binding protein [Emticicia sp. C21]|uniref:ATP-binding protein n=1 Tax=Emticicia sp. C21 TaxID=2302915 RepID=UPI000E350952|nr:ATP-binding protein [Emticicia sp. C21]RFS17351.1 ATP-binding protein [Emticicia sp. C21]